MYITLWTLTVLYIISDVTIFHSDSLDKVIIDHSHSFT